MKSPALLALLMVSGCASASRHVSSARLTDVLTPGTSYVCQGGMTARFVDGDLSFGSKRSAKEDKEFSSLGRMPLVTDGFDVDHSKEPGFLATMVGSDQGGAWPEAQLYAIGKDHFRLVPNGGSTLNEGECSANR